MAQLGAAADSAGQKTTPETAQRVIAAQYTNSSVSPVVAGGKVTGSGTLVYRVAAGVGLHATGAGAVYVAWGETDTSLTSAPASGTATDVIGVDADGVVGVWRDGAQPPGCVVLDRRTIPAGTTATAATTSSYDVKYATPYGAQLGELAYWQENAAPGDAAADDWTVTMDFGLPQDRNIAVEVCQEIKTENMQEMNPAAVRWSVSLDGGPATVFELPADRRRVLRQHSVFFRGLGVGHHTVTVARHTMWKQNDRTVLTHFGGADGYQNGFYRVRDLGPAE